jgi:hypothetical protein
MKNWLNEKDTVKNLQSKMRTVLIQNFYNTKLGQQLQEDEMQNFRFTFDPLKLALSTMFAEFLYNQKFYFTLSIFISENKFKELPNFEKENFRFNEQEIDGILKLLGIPKSEKTNQKVVKKYVDPGQMESLIYLLLKQLVSAQKPTILASAGTQFDEIPIAQETSELNSSVVKKIIKKKSRVGKSRIKKKSRPNDVDLIVHNLVGMSTSISAISEKLDRFKKFDETEVSEEKLDILTLVANTCRNLNDCVDNFENLCENIKNAKEPIQNQVKSFDGWMNELEHSENGKKFLRKLRKSYKSIVSEERSKIKREFRRKLSNEKQKLKKEKQKHDKSVDLIETKLKELNIKEKSLEYKLNLLDKKLIEPKSTTENNVVDEITDFLKNTALTLKSLEKENELHEKTMAINMERNNMDKKKLLEEKGEIPGNLIDQKLKVGDAKTQKYYRMGDRKVRTTKTVIISSSSLGTSTSESSSEPSKKNQI